MEEARIRTLQLISVRWWNANAAYGITLAMVLTRAGFPTIVGGTPGSPPIEQAETFNLPVFTDINLESLNPARLLKNSREMKKCIREHSIDLINAHRPEDHLFGALVGRKRAGIPLIRSVGDVRAPKNNPVNRWLHLNATDFFIFSCAASQRRYQEVWPIPDDKCRIIYGAIDTDYFRPPENSSRLRKTLNIPEDTPVFGLVGRFSPVKDHHNFLLAAAMLQKETNSAHFIISGEEVEISRAELLETARELGIASKVHLLKKQQDVRDVISAIDVGVINSMGSEAISRIATEFMAMSRPVIVTGVNVLPEMVNAHREGLVIPPRSPEELAGAMRFFVKNPRRIPEYGINARESAEKRFSYSAFLRETVSVYHEVLEQEKRKE